jgi:hypothetical protein
VLKQSEFAGQLALLQSCAPLGTVAFAAKQSVSLLASPESWHVVPLAHTGASQISKQ